MPFHVASDLVRRFLAFFDAGATFFTNGEHADDGGLERWDPLTLATFDTGIIAVERTNAGTLWIEDED